jgi:hypothetical protein
MPSMTTSQLSELYSTATSSFTYTNKMILDTHDRGAYLVVDFKQDATGTTISAHPDVEVSVKSDATSNMIQEQFGSRPETRSSIQSGKALLNKSRKDNEGRRLLTVGAFITLVDNQGQSGVPLHFRNGNMPLANSWTHPSGIASEKPHKALWQRVNEEAGYCYVDKVNKEINVVVLQPDRETLEQNADLLDKIINDKMKNQRYIRLAVSEKTGISEITNTDEWNIKIVRVDSSFDFSHNQEKSGLIDQVQFAGLLAGQAAMPACVHDDPQRQTVSLTVPLKAKVPFPLDQMVLIDPEGFNRKVALHSEADLTMLSTAKIPALEDFISKLNGQAPAQHRVALPAPAVAAAPTPAT